MSSERTEQIDVRYVAKLARIDLSEAECETFQEPVMFFKLCSSATTCPVCVSRIWANTGCRKHQQSKKYMGLSYRLRIAVKILTRQPYRCPYCAERFSSKNAIQ